MQAYDAPTSQQILLTLDKDLFRDFFCVLKLLKILFCAIEFIDLGYPLMNCELGAWFHYFSFLGVTRMRCVYWNLGEEVPVCMSGRQCQADHDFTSHGPFPWFQWGALFYFPLTKQHHSFGQNTAALHWGAFSSQMWKFLGVTSMFDHMYYHGTTVKKNTSSTPQHGSIKAHWPDLAHRTVRPEMDTSLPFSSRKKVGFC